jgi:hypothetical protein
MERISASSTAFSVGKAGAATVVIVIFWGKGNRTLDYRRLRPTIARICGDFLCTGPYFVMNQGGLIIIWHDFCNRAVQIGI